MKDRMTSKEAAEALGLSYAAFVKQASRKKITPELYGREFVWTPELLDQLRTKAPKA